MWLKGTWLIVVSLLIAWFISLHIQQRKLNQYYNNDNRSSLEKVALLRGAYIPNIYTHTNNNESIAFLLAKEYNKLEALDDAMILL